MVSTQMEQPLDSAASDALYSIIKKSVESNLNTSEVLREVKIDFEYLKSTSNATNVDAILDRLLDTCLDQMRMMLRDSRNDWRRYESGSAIIEDEVKFGRETCVRQAPAANAKDTTIRKKKQGSEATAKKAELVKAEPRSVLSKEIESKATNFGKPAVKRASKKGPAIFGKGTHNTEDKKVPSS